MLPGKKLLLYSMDQEQSKKARPVRYLFESWIWWSPRLYQPTYVSPPSIGTSYCNLDSLTGFVRWEMRNERRILLLGIRSYSLSPLFTENREMNWSIHRILGRDWQGSNLQLTNSRRKCTKYPWVKLKYIWDLTF